MSPNRAHANLYDDDLADLMTTDIPDAIYTWTSGTGACVREVYDAPVDGVTMRASVLY